MAVLVTSDGYPVQGDGGAITVTPATARSVSAPTASFPAFCNGASNQIGKLQVVGFADERALVKQGANLYSTTQTANPVPGSTIAQRMLESSNVSPVIEISHMVEVMRAYQMTATMTNSEEELMRQAIDKLGSTPN